MVVGANLVFAHVSNCKVVWRREKGEHKVRPYNVLKICDVWGYFGARP